MAKVTRIAYSKNLTHSKYELEDIASRLGKLRTEIWQRYGSISGVGLTSRQIRNRWLAAKQEFDVPARLWKATLRDTIGDIAAYREAAQVKVRKAIQRRTDDKEQRKRLYTLLKYDRWLKDSYLRRMMRKYCKHGHSRVENQIILDTNSYTTFEHREQGWLKTQSLKRNKRIAIPLNTKAPPTGTLRLILRSGKVEVHYAVKETMVCSTAPCGDAVVGIDKGYTEAFVDSDGKRHGDGLGEILSQESDYGKVKYQRRNRLRAIAEAKPHKRKNIEQNNLGYKKLNKRRQEHKRWVRDLVFKAVHSVVDKAAVIVCEDLTSPISGSLYGKDQKRRLSGWVKGLLAEAIESISRRRGVSVVLVNGAYTSQMDSRYDILLGKRSGDSFHCFDGEVIDADINAARNILARAGDSEIQLYTPYRKVKSILLERTERKKNELGLLNSDSSCTPPPTSLPVPTADRKVDINGERSTGQL